jgi:hypothetical protein
MNPFDYEKVKKKEKMYFSTLLKEEIFSILYAVKKTSSTKSIFHDYLARDYNYDPYTPEVFKEIEHSLDYFFPLDIKTFHYEKINQPEYDIHVDDILDARHGNLENKESK